MSGTNVEGDLHLMPSDTCDCAIDCITVIVPCLGRTSDHFLVEDHSMLSHLLVLVDGYGLNDGDHKSLKPD